jgi:hypothetical protein
MNSSSKAVTLLARLSLAAAAAAALVACGGGDEETFDDKTASMRLQAISGGPCALSIDASATSTGGVVPTLCPGSELNGGDTGAKTSCLDLLGPTVGGYPVKEYGVKTDGSGLPFLTWDETGAPVAQPPFLTVNVVGNLAQPLSWSTTDTATTDYQVVAVLLKSGGQTHIYPYTTASGDSQLDPPRTDLQTLWYNVCYIAKPIITTPPQWCSPGYWKNHTDAWPVPTNTLYTLSTLTIKAGGKGCSAAPGNGVATLYDVVSMPQCYGGDAANLVGDYLSAKAGLNFTGERIENCPLN